MYVPVLYYIVLHYLMYYIVLHYLIYYIVLHYLMRVAWLGVHNSNLLQAAEQLVYNQNKTKGCAKEGIVHRNRHKAHGRERWWAEACKRAAQGGGLTAALFIWLCSSVCSSRQHNLLPRGASRLGGLLDEALQDGAREVDERLLHVFFRLCAGFEKSHAEFLRKLLALQPHAR